MFPSQQTSTRRLAKKNRTHSLRHRQLRLESLEARRLFCVAHGTSEEHEHPVDVGHAEGVTVTDTTVNTHHDSIPRFGANPSNVAVLDGLWSDANVWSTGQVPRADDVVSIPAGISVVYDVNSAIKLDAIEVSGRLDFATGVNTSLWLNELMVMPSGTLTIGTEANPVAASVTSEIVITDTPGMNGMHYKTGTVGKPGIDPMQWGNGILTFGTLEVHGQEKTSSYIRLAQEPLAGDRVLVLESAPQGWKAGDELVLPDTPSDWQRAKVEKLVVRSVDGNRVTLTQPLLYDHQGPRASVGGAPLHLPHIGNLSRNVVIRSENASGVRGHVISFAHADVDVNYARFKDLGRTTSNKLDPTTFNSNGKVTHIGTNQIGRYALHFHHVVGPKNPSDSGFQFEVTGNAVDGAQRWAVTVHGSHYGLIKDNFVYDYQGAGFVAEGGDESYNLFEGNFAVLSNATGNFKTGVAGEGFWFRSPLTSAIDNVSANSQRAGFDYFAQDLHGQNRDLWKKPAFRGADMAMDAEVIWHNVHRTPMLQFEGNEIYASAAVFDNWSSAPNERQFLGSTTAWNTSDNNFSVSSYVNRNLVIDGLKLTGDMTRLNPDKAQKHQPISQIGIEAVRDSDNISIFNSEVRGVQTGFRTPPRPAGEMVIANSLFQAYVGVHVDTMTSSEDVESSSDYARLVIENTRFERMPENNVERDQYAIYMEFDMNTNLTKTNEVFLYDFNGVRGANYRVYYPEQAPNFIVPQTSSTAIGSPEAGLTNAQNWAKYGIAIGGSVAPSREIDGDNGEAALARGRALGIHGLVFPLTGEAALNQPPVVDAGSAMTVEQYKQVPLSGQVSDDGRLTGAAGGIAHVDWSKRSGPGEVSFVNSGAAQTLAMFTEPGTYVMRLTASDGLRESYQDVTVTVLAADNRAPVVNAGNDVVLGDTNKITLQGTASDDGNPCGTLVTQWSVVSGPGRAEIANPESLTTEVTFAKQGDYVLELQATDGELVSSTYIKITVKVAFPSSPLRAHLEMNDGKATDSSLHDLHGEAVGVSETTGKFGAGLNFTGTSHLAMPVHDFLQPKTGLTAAVWVCPSVTDDVERPVLVWSGGSWKAYRIMLTNSGSSARVSAGVAIGGNHTIRVITEPFSTNAWTHLALTYSQDNGGEIRLYRDGKLIGSERGIGSVIDYKTGSEQRLAVGKETPSSTEPGFIGAMDDLHLFDYALTPAELADLMSKEQAQTAATSNTSMQTASTTEDQQASQSMQPMLLSTDAGATEASATSSYQPSDSQLVDDTILVASEVENETSLASLEEVSLSSIDAVFAEGLMLEV